MKEILLGNGAIALGAVAAGVNLVSGYPGTPSTEVLQTVAKYNKDGKIYVEWSTNEKAAMEVAAGASYSGARTMVTMKQVGLNVASDPLMCLSYIGIKGGMVVLVADDPGPISSQTEQDTRHFGEYANIPVLDPSSPEEAYEMTKYAFELSEHIGMPVIMRPTTKVCHASAAIELDEPAVHEYDGFTKDPRWVIFPPLSYKRHIEIEKQQPVISGIFDEIRYNSITGTSKTGIAAGGVTAAIAMDVIRSLGVEDKVSFLKVGAVFPAPKGLYKKFLSMTDRILVLEELDPVIETGLTYAKAENAITDVAITGKLDFRINPAGELKFDLVRKYICEYLSLDYTDNSCKPMELPARPPVLCAGCPHRASFYAVKKAMKNRKSVFCGDIGCYTLGNAKPLDMVDTCLCMGAGITAAQGIKRTNPDTNAFAFIGDSTFFASGMTGLANAVYNNTNINVIILDNSTTAMTGHQPHPGTGRTMMETQSARIDPVKVAKALNAGFVEEADPYDLDKAIETVRAAAEYDGVSVVVFRAPCIAVSKPSGLYITENCTGCMHCINEIGCPAMYIEDSKVKINDTLCFGCGLCAQICPGKKIIKA
ncbi:MAG: indolepyruvate ferredoxin oxidoreductase subunit alpha [Oscillospiraceae bacterium]|nr:indolepyruvate ferredoxin oxidoreductase subunit alpha [Oscillospiraceae bacterium]